MNFYDQDRVLAESLNMEYSEKHHTIYGTRGGFPFIIHRDPKSNYSQLSIHSSARREDGYVITTDESKSFSKSNKSIINLTNKCNDYTMNTKTYSNLEKYIESITEAIDAKIEFIKSHGLVPCCSSCGRTDSTEAFVYGNRYGNLCHNCQAKMALHYSSEERNLYEKDERVVAGVIGAIVGSFAGVLAIVILGRIGIMAYVSGIIMAMCALKGYEFFAGKISTKGAIISLAIMIIMTLFAYRLTVAFEVQSFFEGQASYIESLLSIGEMKRVGYIDTFSYNMNLLLLSFFTVVPAAIRIASLIKTQKSAFIVEKMV